MYNEKKEPKKFQFKKRITNIIEAGQCRANSKQRRILNVHNSARLWIVEVAQLN